MRVRSGTVGDRGADRSSGKIQVNSASDNSVPVDHAHNNGLTIADFTHESIDIAVDHGIGGVYVTRILDQALILCGNVWNHRYGDF